MIPGEEKKQRRTREKDEVGNWVGKGVREKEGEIRV